MFFFEQFLYLQSLDLLVLAGVLANILFALIVWRFFLARFLNRYVAKAIALILILPATLVFYAFFIEPNWLMTKTYQVDAPQVDLVDPIRIVVIGDLQAKTYLTPSFIPHIVERVNAVDADYVVWVGDLFQGGNVWDEPILMQLADITARDGKIAVLGNHDYRIYQTDPFDSYISETAERILTKSGFEVLNNEVFTTQTGEIKITWGGTVDLWTERVDFQKINAEVYDKGNALNLLVAHQPLTVLENDQSDLYALTFSGHCHAGQINLLFLNKPLGFPKVPPGCPENTNQIQGLMTHNNHLILTTPGLGTLNMRARFLAPPEVSVVEVF